MLIVVRHVNCRSPFSVDKPVNKDHPVAEDAGFEPSAQQSAYFLSIGVPPMGPLVIVEVGD